MGTDKADNALAAWVSEQTKGLIGGNGKVLETTDLTLPEHEPGVWYGQDGREPRQVRLAQEDVLEFSLLLTDTLGREIVCSETVLGDEDAPRASQRIP